MKRTIEVIVSTTGEISIQAVNFQGADCEKATQYLEEALGTTTAKTKKWEFYQKTVQSSKQQLGS